MLLWVESKDYQAREDKFFQHKTVSDSKTQYNWQIDKFSSLLPQQQQQFRKLEVRCSHLKILQYNYEKVPSRVKNY